MNSLKNNDIVAIATAYGVGSICVIRLSGPNALKIALKLTKISTLKPRYATLSKIYSLKDEFLDEGILLYFKAPASFTGEDVVEFQMHGGFIVADMIISQLLLAGARLAKPGEFSKRAFLNNKIDLIKAEAIQNLINSRSEAAAKILARQMCGDLGKYVEQMRLDLVRTLAFIETSIDYADDDLPSDLSKQIIFMLKENSKNLNHIVDISQKRRGLIDGFKIAIIGKPNVGKSSILNALLNYERAIISDEAGTTRDRIEENFRLGTHLVRIIDTAGIRKEADKIEAIGIAHSLKAIDEADIILAIFDGSNLASEQDEKILDLVKNSGKKVFYIINKIDLKMKFDYKKLPFFIKISAKNGVNEIIKELERYLNTQDSTELMLSSTHQIECCKSAAQAILRALEVLGEGELELFSYEINKAIAEIASITRAFDRDEILDEMFANFCLGK